ARLPATTDCNSSKQPGHSIRTARLYNTRGVCYRTRTDRGSRSLWFAQRQLASADPPADDELHYADANDP
ncbi:unnamed protein product, partial [Laminaria digitata]